MNKVKFFVVTLPKIQSYRKSKRWLPYETTQKYERNGCHFNGQMLGFQVTFHFKIKKLMVTFSPDNRPTFEQIYTTLQEIYKGEEEEIVGGIHNVDSTGPNYMLTTDSSTTNEAKQSNYN
jgi:hypothetical protein